jgi:hypothetical protein
VTDHSRTADCATAVDETTAMMQKEEAAAVKAAAETAAVEMRG